MKSIKKSLLYMLLLAVMMLAMPTQASAKVKISKKSVTLIKGQTVTLKITGTKSKAKWSSSKKSIATVSSKGKVVAKKKGTATITAKIGKKKYTCRVKVETPKLSKSSLSLTKGKTATLKVSGTSQKITWKSSNKKIATVTSKGVVKGIKTGSCKITASIGKKIYSCKVTVKENKKAVAITGIKLSESSLIMKENESKKIVATVQPSNATNKTVTWSSSNSAIATVDNAGNVQAKSTGVATITAVCGGKKATCSVTVKSAIIVNRTCIYSGNNIFIYATKFEEKESTYNIGIYIENNSSLNLGLNARAYAVNGIMTGNNIYDMDCDVAAGRKANTNLEIEKSFLNEKGISSIKYVDLLIWAYDNAKSYKEFDTGQLIIRTSAFDGSAGKRFVGTPVYNANGIRIDRLASNGNNFTYVLSNNSGVYLDFDVKNLTVNDFTSSKYDYNTSGIIVLNQCQSIFTVSIDNNFMSENGISQINKVEFSLNIRPEEDYFKEWSTELIKG